MKVPSQAFMGTFEVMEQRELAAAQEEPSPTAPEGWTLRDEANLLTLVCFRNSFLEDLHADDRGIGDAEMKKLMIETSAKLARWLLFRDRAMRARPSGLQRRGYHAYLTFHRAFGGIEDWERRATTHTIPTEDSVGGGRTCCDRGCASHWAFCPTCGKPLTAREA